MNPSLRWTWILAAALTGAGCAPAAPPPPAPSPPMVAAPAPTPVAAEAPNPAAAEAPAPVHDPRQDSAAVVAIVERFHQALASGDSAAALALLAPDAVILESGGAESVAEYRGHHLPADIAFARAVPRQRSPVHATVRGDAAWAHSTGTVQGTFRERAVNMQSAELMVLVRAGAGWRIAAIHWSSRSRSR